MNPILTKDPRGLTDVEPINFQAREIVFYDMKITGNFAKAIEQMVQGNFYFMHKDTTKVPYTDSIELYDMAGNYFVVEYQSEEKRNSDIQSLKDNFSYDEKEIFAKKIVDGDKERQVPDYKGRFEHDGKSYLIVGALNKLTGEINPEKGIYKGVILSPDSYYCVSEKIQDSQKSVGDSVNDIIDNSESDGNNPT